MQSPLLDLTLQAVLASLIVQGLKQMGMDGDKYGKVVALCVGAMFLVANGLIDLFVPADYRPAAQSVVDAIKAILLIFAPPGVYGAVKMFTRPQAA
jgi:hypothetical protein